MLVLETHSVGPAGPFGSSSSPKDNASRSRVLHTLGAAIAAGLFFFTSPLYAACNLPPEKQ